MQKSQLLLLVLTFFIHFKTHAETLITVEPAEQLSFFPKRSAPAVVVPLNQSLIPSELSAKISQMHVTVGDNVKKGDTLVSLNCRNTKLIFDSEKAKYKQLKEQAEFAKREYERGRALAKQKNIGAAELDNRKTLAANAKSAYTGQKGAVELADLNVSRCDIKAPFDGIVTQRIANIGEMIDFGKPVVELLDTDNLEVSAKIASDEITSFLQAQNYQLIANQQNNHQGNQQGNEITLKSLLPYIGKNNRSQEARFTVSNSNIIAGTTGRVQWLTPQAFLPAHIMTTRNGKNGFFIEENGTAKFIAVANAEEGRPIEFTLAANTPIIVEGRHGLNHGDKVKVIGAKTKANN